MFGLKEELSVVKQKNRHLMDELDEASLSQVRHASLNRRMKQDLFEFVYYGALYFNRTG